MMKNKDQNPAGVSWLLLLDTEGLQSSERHDAEYDKKIVLFAMLSSDVLIINNKREIGSKMIETLQMCTVTYDLLNKIGKPPNVYITHTQCSDLGE